LVDAEENTNDGHGLDIISSITHELRTPINSTKGFLELAMKDPELSLETREKLKKALESVRRMSVLVNDLLDLSMIIGSGRFHIYPRWFFLGDIISTVEEDCSHMFPDPEVRFRVELPEELEKLKMRSDPVRIRQVLVNLVDNASKYTIRGYVDLIVMRDGDRLILEVRDTGIGIAPENIERVFEPFFQESSGTDRKSTGTGIGLTLSREIIKRLDGSIEVRSVQGEGTVFHVNLPLESSELDMVENLFSESHGGG